MTSLRTCLIRSAALLSLVVVVSACNGLDMSKIKVGRDNSVSWDDAKTIIKDGNVKSVFQTHAALLKIRMKDGTTYKTQQPNIDAVIAWLKECGKDNSVGVMTE